MAWFVGAPRKGDSSEGSHPDPTAVLTRGLGYFSLCLGAAQLGAPGAINRLIGVRDDVSARRWQRLVGLQELSAAAGILPSRRPLVFLWARTAGDAMHLVVLRRAYERSSTSAGRTALAIGAVIGCFGADLLASVRMSSENELEQEVPSMKGNASITIQGEIDDLAASWRSFEEVPHGASRLGPIEIRGGEPRSGLEWRTREEASEQARGVTRFSEAPGGRGTEIHVSVEFDTPAGAIGAAVKKVAGDEPQQLVRDDLRRLKQLVETGEIARSDGAPSGSSAATQPKQRPAQPLATTAA